MVTNQSHEIFRDVSGSQYCQRKTSEEALRFHSLALPPVAIKPESSPLIAYSVFWMNSEPRSAVVIAQDLGDCLRIASTYGEVMSIHRENDRVILDVKTGAGL